MRVLIPLPDRDFDVTEVSVPWHILSSKGHQVVFSTERGASPEADPLLLTGVLFGQLGADPEPKGFYGRLRDDPAFRAPVPWADVDPASFDGMLLPGGHAKGMRQYLEGQVLLDKIADFVRLDRPLGAICHGTVALARAQVDGRSALHGRRTTCLPRFMEQLAYYITAWKLGGYYRTYPEYVEDEVRRSLANPSHFSRGPLSFARGSAGDHRAAFVVEDGNYLSARWPGDAFLFAERFAQKLEAHRSP